MARRKDLIGNLSSIGSIQTQRRNPFEIVQRPGRVLILHEADHTFRQVWTDGREHPKDLSKMWVGHSIGKWDADTLVIDTAGLNGEPWLDDSGHVFSNQTHLIERVRRVDQNHLSIEITVDDSKSFTTAWTGLTTATLQPGRVLHEDLACGVMNGE